MDETSWHQFEVCTKKVNDDNDEFCECDEQRTPYDFLSIMHYESFSHSNNDKPTMLARKDVIEEKEDDHWGAMSGFIIPGQRYKLSANDIQNINDKYQ